MPADNERIVECVCVLLHVRKHLCHAVGRVVVVAGVSLDCVVLYRSRGVFYLIQTGLVGRSGKKDKYAPIDAFVPFDSRLNAVKVLLEIGIETPFTGSRARPGHEDEHSLRIDVTDIYAIVTA